MPAPTMVVPSDQPTGQSKKGTSGQTMPMVPFARAAKWHIEQSNVQSNIALTAQQQIFNFPLASYGYASAVIITVQATGGTGVAAVAFEDAPWSALAQVQISDVNGVPIYQLSGYHTYLSSKFGGYRPFALDGSALASVYQTVQTSGNFKFVLPVYFEFGMDGLGCLPNMDASARYNVQLTVAAAGAASATGPLYTTLPTALPTLTLTVELLARSQPPAQDMFGNQNSTTPPAVGTIGYWTNQTASGLANGANTIQLTRVGNLVRNHIFVWRNANGTRATAETAGDVPFLFEFDWDVGQRYVANVSSLRAINGYLVYGFDMPNGVLVLPNTLDPDKLPFSEYGDEWLGTVGATKFTLRYTSTAGNGSLSVLTNDIVPASSQVYQAPALMTYGG